MKHTVVNFNNKQKFENIYHLQSKKWVLLNCYEIC